MPRSRLKWAVIGGTCLLLAILIGGQELIQQRTRASAWESAQASVERTARTIESIVNRHILQVDSALASIPSVFEGTNAPGERPTPQAVHRMLQALNYQTFAFRDLLLVQPSGTTWASARLRAGHRPLPVTIDTLRAHLSPGASAVMGPVRNPMTGEWTLYIVRALHLPGLSDMFAVAEVPITTLSTAMASIGEQPGLRVTLERRNGTILASFPYDEWRIGALSPTPVADGPAGTNVGDRNEGGPLAEVGATRPTLYGDIHVVVRMDAAAALADWARDRLRLMVVVAVTALLLLIMALIILTGLHKQERLEVERRTAQKQLEDAVQAMSDGFVMWDENDRLVMFNDQFRDLYAKSAPAIFPGALFRDIIRYGAENGQYPQAGEDLDAFVEEMVAWHLAAKGSFERLLPDGRWLLVTERRTANGGIVGIRTDITELKTQQATIARYSEELERFAHIASHDLQEPLRKIATHTRLLLQAVADKDDAEINRCATVLIASSKRGRDLVSDLLRYSSLKGQALARSDIDIAATLTEVAGRVDDHAAAVPPQIDIQMPSLRVYCDASLIRQVFQNLIDNAAKYRKPAEGARITIWTELDPVRRQRLIHFTDQGIGFDMSHQAAIFEPFRRLVTRSEYEGTGIGLSLVKSIVQKHNWTIAVRSAPGEGSTFTIGVPLADIAAAPATSTAAAA